MFRSLKTNTANFIGFIFVLLSTMGILYFAFTSWELPGLIAFARGLNGGIYVLIGFACLSIISQFLVIPSGTLLIITGGYLLGSIPAALVYTVLLPLTGVVVGEIAKSSSLQHWLKAYLGKHKKISEITELRLTPVIPAAIASTIASTLNIRHTTFIIATLCVGWIRPIFFASIGEAAQSLQQLQDGSLGVTEKSTLPLALLTLGALLNLIVRCWLRSKRKSSTV